MNVHAELLDHPKYLRLKRRISPDALEYLLKLWGHCQNNQRGEFWKGADTEYVELVCKWGGEPGLLFRAFTECRFIDQKQSGIIIHDWNEQNAKLLTAWENGKKHNAQKKTGEKHHSSPTDNPRNNPSVTHSSPTDNPRNNPSPIGLTRSYELDEGDKGERVPAREDSLREPEQAGAGLETPPANSHAPIADSRGQEPIIPTLEEVRTWAMGPSGIDPGWAEERWSYTSEAHGWVKNGRLIDWRSRFKRYWEENRETWLKRSKNGSSHGGTVTHEQVQEAKYRRDRLPKGSPEHKAAQAAVRELMDKWDGSR